MNYKGYSCDHICIEPYEKDWLEGLNVTVLRSKAETVDKIHDIFTPKDYLNDWIFKHHLLWNEQYLLEAFLTFNREFRVFGSLNFLSHNYNKEFSSKCPVFAQSTGREPGSFWLVKN